jgi:signal transduction histidine kinase
LENAVIYYGWVPRGTQLLALALIRLATAMLPALLVHAHFAYGWAESGKSSRLWQHMIVSVNYLLGFGLLGLAIRYFDDASPAYPKIGHFSYARLYLAWFVLVLISSVARETVFARRSRDRASRAFHNSLAVCFAAFGLISINLLTSNSLFWNGAIAGIYSAERSSLWIFWGFHFAWVPALVLFVYAVVRYGVLGIGAQKNLVYSVSIAFLAILYLGVVRRLSGWLEPFLPPEATASILLFVLLAFFEPLQRIASRLLRRRFQEQVDQLQHLSSDLQREAFRGEPGPMLRFAEERVRQEFGLEEARIRLDESRSTSDQRTEGGVGTNLKSRPAWFGQPVRLALGRKGAEIGELVAVPIGSAISGETMAALEFFAEQLPAVIELCRAIEQKVALERELDERERLALVGQMAASISHNLKNPLGSMKTVLQVQLESPELPAAARRDLTMVLGELDRLGAKLNQLLKYARPAVRLGAAPLRVAAGSVAEQVVSLLRHEAERRRGHLTLSDESSGVLVSGSEEALADILSNLVVNAIEAMLEGGAVSMAVRRESAHVVLIVTDDGPGIAAENHASIFRPFFTTKPSGTGLGLAIVERRALELGGIVTCESPIADGHGARFIVRLPIAESTSLRME